MGRRQTPLRLRRSTLPRPSSSPHPGEAPHVPEMFRLYTRQRLGTRAIARRTHPPRHHHRGRQALGQPSSRPRPGQPGLRGRDRPPDVHVPGAHPALVDPATFRRAAEIAAARSGPHTQRAASPSDYHLSSLITLPRLRLQVHRSVRHRTLPDLPVLHLLHPRPATDPPHATPPASPPTKPTPPPCSALAAFYAQETEVLLASFDRAAPSKTPARTNARPRPTPSPPRSRPSKPPCCRYQAAFENGTMDDTTAGPRLRELQQELIALKARQAELRRRQRRTTPAAAARHPRSPARLTPQPRHRPGHRHPAQSRHRSTHPRDPHHRERTHPRVPDPRTRHHDPRTRPGSRNA